jgi:16S rRNA (guanine527-N7)-methyltransferase
VEHQLELRTFTINSIAELGLAIDETHAEQFLRYLSHLIEWNRVINLTAIVDPYEIIIKHFVDSVAALIATTFSKNCRVLDVGSGGGFPGIPLKIMRPDIGLILLEPVQKKCSFLNSMIGLLKLQDVSTFHGTLEQYVGWPLRHTIDTAVIRALKYKDILTYLPAVLASKGKVILYRTETLHNEEIGEYFHFVNETSLTLPQGSGERVISVIEKNI